MSRILAIDFGLKRTGIAVTDPMRLIASGIGTFETKNVLKFLMDYCKTENVEMIVVGDPKNLDNTPSEIADDLEAFILKINDLLPNVPIQKVDERFTSKMAFQAILDSGVPKEKRKNKALIDETSAILILQTYMDRINI